MDDPLWSKRWRGLTLALLLLPSGALAQADRPPRNGLMLAQSDTSANPATGAQMTAKIEAQRDTPDRNGNGNSNEANDPTANVIALQRASTQRQDDLREASERFILAKIEALEVLQRERQENSRYLREAESKRIDALTVLRSELETRLEIAESARIDAIRTVDVNAVASDNERAAQQATGLAQQVTTAAETLRTLVASTEASVAAAQEQSNTAIGNRIDSLAITLGNRISALEQAQYVGQGQSSQRDPAFTRLEALVEELASSRSVIAGEASQRDPALVAMQVALDRLISREASTTGQTEGSSNMVGLIFGGIGALLGIIGIVSAVALALRRPQQPASNGTRQNGNGGAYA